MLGISQRMKYNAALIHIKMMVYLVVQEVGLQVMHLAVQLQLSRVGLQIQVKVPLAVTH